MKTLGKGCAVLIEISENEWINPFYIASIEVIKRKKMVFLVGDECGRVLNEKYCSMKDILEIMFHYNRSDALESNKKERENVNKS